MELDCILRNTYLSTRVLYTIMSFSPNFDQSTQLLVLRADLFRVLFCFVLSQTNQIGSHMAAQILCLIQSTGWSRIRQVPAQDHCHAGRACWECQCSWKHFRSSSLLIVRILSAREKWQGPRTSICHPWKYCSFVFGGLCLGHMVFSMIWYMVYLMILIGLTLLSLKSAMWNNNPLAVVFKCRSLNSSVFFSCSFKMSSSVSSSLMSHLLPVFLLLWLILSEAWSTGSLVWSQLTKIKLIDNIILKCFLWVVGKLDEQVLGVEIWVVREKWLRNILARTTTKEAASL